MNTGTFRMKIARPFNDNRMIRFTCEFEGVTTKQEFDRFVMALSDGQFHFKRTEELGNGREWTK